MADAPPTYSEAVPVGAAPGAAPAERTAAVGRSGHAAASPSSQGQAPPPSYESLYGRLQSAKRDSADNKSFAKKAAQIVFGSLGCLLLTALVAGVPVAMVVVGAVYFHACPVERYIPVYLIVMGSFGCVQLLWKIYQRLSSCNSEEEYEPKAHPLEGLVTCFLVAWFIAGNVWIYRVHPPSTDPRSDRYCQPTLYWFAFWLTTLAYILLALVCVCCCCVGVCLATSAGAKGEDDAEGGRAGLDNAAAAGAP